jgi:flagellin-like protein
MKGLSPLIGAIILITITFTLAAAMSPWITRLAQQTTNQTGQNVNREIYCREMSYDFVQDYGTYGIDWDFSGTDDSLSVKIKNYGTVDVFDFSFELELSDYSLKRFDATPESDINETDPLRPGESAVIEADITEDLQQGLNRVTVMNGMDCTPLSQKT